jgi:hypothetical protein
VSVDADSEFESIDIPDDPSLDEAGNDLIDYEGEFLPGDSDGITVAPSIETALDDDFNELD